MARRQLVASQQQPCSVQPARLPAAEVGSLAAQLGCQLYGGEFVDLAVAGRPTAVGRLRKMRGAKPTLTAASFSSVMQGPNLCGCGEAVPGRSPPDFETQSPGWFQSFSQQPSRCRIGLGINTMSHEVSGAIVLNSSFIRKLPADGITCGGHLALECLASQQPYALQASPMRPPQQRKGPAVRPAPRAAPPRVRGRPVWPNAQW